jgi:hypothetical protein
MTTNPLMPVNGPETTVNTTRGGNDFPLPTIHRDAPTSTTKPPASPYNQNPSSGYRSETGAAGEGK